MLGVGPYSEPRCLGRANGLARASASQPLVPQLKLITSGKSGLVRAGWGQMVIIFLHNIVDIRGRNDVTIHHVQYTCQYQELQYIRIQMFFSVRHQVEHWHQDRKVYSDNFHQHTNPVL